MDYKLHKAENRWQRYGKSSGNADDSGKREEILRAVNSILNKVTVDNLEKLSKDLVSKLIADELLLVGVIDLIFEKALGEAKFSQVYASLCSILHKEATVFETVKSEQRVKYIYFFKLFWGIF